MLQHVEKTASTQTLAKESDIKNKEGFYTFNQTKGYGRLGSKWIDKKNKTLAFSFRNDNTTFFPKSMIVGVELCEILSKYGDFKVKWPNDIYLNDKKIAGILVERMIQGDDKYDIIGIGINIESHGKFTGLEMISKEAVMIANKLTLSDLNVFSFDIFNRCNYLVDKRIVLDDTNYYYKSIKDNGELELVDDEGNVTVINETSKIGSNVFDK